MPVVVAVVAEIIKIPALLAEVLVVVEMEPRGVQQLVLVEQILAVAVVDKAVVITLAEEVQVQVDLVL
jgi:hypothetical protein